MNRRLISAAVVTAMVMLGQTPLAQAAQKSSTTRTLAEKNLKDFDFMVDKITINYAGYDTKIAGDRRTKLAAHTARLRAKAASVSNDDLAAVMTEWVGFFRDEHTYVSALSQNAAGENLASSVPRRNLTEISLKQKLAALGDRRDPVEGIWSINGDRYRLAVLRTGSTADNFSAVVLSATADGWVPGMIKATMQRKATGAFDMQYRVADFSIERLAASVKAEGAVLDTGAYGIWSREWPITKSLHDPDKLSPSPAFFLRRLSPDTLWIRIPNFNDDNAGILSKLMADNAPALAETKNLIIDTRRNGGGSDYVYDPIIPYIYTRPIYSIGIEMRASADNIALRQAIVAKLQKIPEGQETAKQLVAQNELMRKNLGGYVQPDSQPFSIRRLDQILPFPKRVAILIDLAGSTGEEFLLAARQSSKVTLFGNQNSAGVLDFANVVSMPSPSGRFNLQWATSRSLRLPNDPVDEGGIAPDVRIPDSVIDPITYVQNWLERQAD